MRRGALPRTGAERLDRALHFKRRDPQRQSSVLRVSVKGELLIKADFFLFSVKTINGNESPISIPPPRPVCPLGSRHPSPTFWRPPRVCWQLTNWSHPGEVAAGAGSQSSAECQVRSASTGYLGCCFQSQRKLRSEFSGKECGDRLPMSATGMGRVCVTSMPGICHFGL